MHLACKQLSFTKSFPASQLNLHQGTVLPTLRLRRTPWRGLADQPSSLEVDEKGVRYNNVSYGIRDKLTKRLHNQPSHPLCLLKNGIQRYFADSFKNPKTGAPIFEFFDSFDPKVTTKQNFDELLIPKDHISRSRSDTFYVDRDTVLRTHTSAHQTELLRADKRAFLVFGDVYRRDAIDATHYPVFHQMEGVRIFDQRSQEAALLDLKRTLEGLVKALFGDVKMRWVEGSFPFTDPSLEMEIFWNNEWLEVLGCGLVHRQILNNCKLDNTSGWAFGVGLERIAMVLFGIPDIRLFWSNDERFLSQFSKVRDVRPEQLRSIRFEPYSKYPPCTKDITFWLSDKFQENDFFSMVREVAGDLVERVTLVDKFTKPSTNQTSHCYRIIYRSMDRNLTNEEINQLQEQVRRGVVHEFGVKIR